jgi:hypothetical protein
MVRVAHSSIRGGVYFPAGEVTWFFSDVGFDKYFNLDCQKLQGP